MRSAIGLVFAFAGVLCAFYGGLWWGFVGGAIQLIKAVRADVLLETEVIYGIARIVFSGVIAWVSSMPCFLIAMLFLRDKQARKLKRYAGR